MQRQKQKLRCSPAMGTKLTKVLGKFFWRMSRVLLKFFAYPKELPSCQASTCSSVHIRLLPTNTISSVTSVCQRIKLPRALSFEPITQSLAFRYVLGFFKSLQRWEYYFQRSFSYPHCGVADMSACVIMPDYYGHLNYHGWLWSPTSATIQYNLLVLQDMSWNSECEI